MGKLQHVYITAHGEFTSTNWVGEFGQIGIRCAVENEGSLPAKGTVFTPFSDHGDVSPDTGTQAGTNGTLTRTWTCRLGAAGSAENADAAWQADLADDMWAFLNAAKAYQSNGWRWTHIKIAPILADGKYGASAATYQITTPLVGASAGGLMPPECAVAVSLRAGILGRRGRGRMYLPGLSTNIIASDGTTASAAQTSLLSSLGTLVTNLENAPGTEVFSPLVIVTSAGNATAVRPSQVRVGNHIDVQRRRQAQVKETYAAAAL